MSRVALSCVDRAQREILPLSLALYHAGRDYPGGAAAIAALYGRNPSTMQHKLSPTQTSHQLNPSEVEELVTATRDRRIVDSVIEAFGDAAWVDLRPLIHEFGVAGDGLAGVLQAVGLLLKKQSALTEAIGQHLADGQLDDDELAECRLLIRRLQGALLLLERTMEQHAGGGRHG